MIAIIVAQRPPNRKWLTRDWGQYTLTAYENHHMTDFKIITMHEAIAFVEASPNGRIIGSDPVDFSTGLIQFTFEVAT